MLKNVSPEIDVETIKLDPENFEEMVTTINKKLKETKGELILNLGGGDRAILIALIVAAIYTPRKIDISTIFSDTTRQRTEITLPRQKYRLNKKEKKTINCIKNNPSLDNTELSNKTNISKSTISRIIKNFEEKGYVTTKKSGRRKLIKPTLKSKLIN